MKHVLFALALSIACWGTAAFSVQAEEEKVEVKEKSDGSWKMKVKRKGDKEWVGTYNDKSYVLRGDVDFSTVKDDGDYTVYGRMAPDNAYITTTKITRVETK